jgi:hypothetical protein
MIGTGTQMRSTNRLTLVIILFLMISLRGYGQSEDKLGSWYIYNGFFNVSPKVELFFETQLRTYEVFSNPETFFLRPYFNYNITKQVQMGLGLEYHKNWTYDAVPENKVSTEEFRITLQTMLFQKVGRVALQHRYRYEFRNVEADKLQRMRYRIQATIPLNSKSMEAGTIFLNTFNEIMIDTNPAFNFSQDRIYLAGGYQFNQALNLQVGYLAILRQGTVHHRLQFFITHKLFFYEL